MKSNKIKVVVIIGILMTVLFAVAHFHTRENIPENALQITADNKVYMVDITKLTYEQVTGTRVNGKGETLEVNGKGILLKEVFNQNNISDYSKVKIVSDDSYQVEVTGEEIQEDTKVYVLYEENTLRLIVFGDKDSKRSVSNVVQMIVE